MTWSDTQASGDTITYTEWNNMVKMIKHRGSEFTDWRDFYDENDVNFISLDYDSSVSRIYGPPNASDDLVIHSSKAGGTSQKPNIQLLGNSDISLVSARDIYFKSGTTQMCLFRYASNLSTLYGGGVSGDDLTIKANSADTYPYLLLYGNDDVNLTLPAGKGFAQFEGGDRKFRLDSSGIYSIIEGADTSAYGLRLKANSKDSYPLIDLIGSGDVILDTYDDVYFYKTGSETFQFTHNRTTSNLYGGSHDEKIVIKGNTSNTQYISVGDSSTVGVGLGSETPHTFRIWRDGTPILVFNPSTASKRTDLMIGWSDQEARFRHYVTEQSYISFYGEDHATHPGDIRIKASSSILLSGNKISISSQLQAHTISCQVYHGPSTGGGTGGSGQHYSYDYIIYKDGITYYTRNGINGTSVSSSTDAASLFNYTLGLMDSGGTLFIEPGLYNMSGALGLSLNNFNNIDIIGYGAHLKRSWTKSGQAGQLLSIDSCNNITVRGLTLDSSECGTYTNNGSRQQTTIYQPTAPSSAGMRWTITIKDSSQHISFYDLNVISSQCGVVSANNPRYISFKNCYFNKIGEHTQYLGEISGVVFDSCIHSNWAKYIRGYAPKLTNDCYGVTYINCRYYANEDGTGHADGSTHPQPPNWTDWGGYGPVLDAHIKRNIRFIGCEWIGDGTQDNSFDLDNASNTYCSGSDIHLNGCKFYKMGPITFYGANVSSNYASMVGCTYYGNSGSTGSIRTPPLVDNCNFINPYTIYPSTNHIIQNSTFILDNINHNYSTIAPLYDSHKVKILNNRFFGWYYRVINVNGKEDWTIKDNYFNRGTTSWVINPGIRTVIDNNNLDDAGGTGYTIYTPNGSDCTLTNNRFATTLTFSDMNNGDDTNYRYIANNIGWDGDFRVRVSGSLYAKSISSQAISGGSITTDTIYLNHIRQHGAGTYPNITLNDAGDILISSEPGEQITFNSGSGRIFMMDRFAGLSLLYGGNTTGDDINIRANSADAYPYLRLYGADKIEACFSSAGGKFAFLEDGIEGGNVAIDDTNFYVRGASGKNLIFQANGVNDYLVRFISGSVYTHRFGYNAANNYSTIYGGNITGDDLHIYANTTDSYPFIRIRGDDQTAIINKNAGVHKYLFGGEQAENVAVQMDLNVSNLYSTIYGRQYTSGQLYIRPNSIDAYPYILLDGSGNIELYPKVDYISGTTISGGSIITNSLGVNMAKFTPSSPFHMQHSGGASFGHNSMTGTLRGFVNVQLTDDDNTDFIQAIKMHANKAGLDTLYGFNGTAIGANTTNIGIYAYAGGATNNYGLYIDAGDALFKGDAYFRGNFSSQCISTQAISGGSIKAGLYSSQTGIYADWVSGNNTNLVGASDYLKDNADDTTTGVLTATGIDADGISGTTISGGNIIGDIINPYTIIFYKDSDTHECFAKDGYNGSIISSAIGLDYNVIQYAIDKKTEVNPRATMSLFFKRCSGQVGGAEFKGTEYNISSTIYISSSVFIDSDMACLNFKSLTSPLFVIGQPNVVGHRKSRIGNLIIAGNSSKADNTFLKSLKNTIIVENIKGKIGNYPETFVILSGSCYWSHIRNCVINGGKVGVNLIDGPNASYISNCDFGSSKHMIIASGGTGDTQLNIYNCWWEGSPSSAIYLNDIGNANIHDNYFQMSSPTGCYCIDANSINSIFIHDNNFSFTGGRPRGIKLRAYIPGMVHNNRFSCNSGRRDLVNVHLISGTGTSSVNTFITNNEFKYVSQNTGYCISGNLVQRTIITNNKFDGCSQTPDSGGAIFLKNSYYNSISENYFMDFDEPINIAGHSNKVCNNYGRNGILNNINNTGENYLRDTEMGTQITSKTALTYSPYIYSSASKRYWEYFDGSDNWQARFHKSGDNPEFSSISSQTISGGTIKGASAYRGWANVSDAGTIAHGCPSKPSYVNLSPSGANPIMYSFTVDATNITVYHSSPDAEDFSWRAEV